MQSFYQTSAANRSNCFSIGHHSWVSPPVAMTTDDIINLVDPRQVDANAWTKSTSLSNSKYLIGIQRIKGRPSHVLVIVPTHSLIFGGFQRPQNDEAISKNCDWNQTRIFCTISPWSISFRSIKFQSEVLDNDYNNCSI